ncbi:MAG: CDK5RAP3 family protein [Defluviitaleaceae bacterium]|nr:CDK5RAP3 family protein [Defluviitaleaceae bacterium]
MESRKQRNLAIERAKRKKRAVAKSVMTAILILFVAWLGYTIWDIANRSTIMRYNGTRIAATDFRFFNQLMGHAPSAMDNLQQVLVLMDRDKQHGFTAPEEQWDEALEVASELRGRGTFNFITENRMAELYYAAWGASYERLRDVYIPADTFVVDEEAYAAQLESEMPAINLMSTQLELKYLYSPDPITVQVAAQEFAEGGVTFDELIKKHCNRQFIEEEIEAKEYNELLQELDLWEHYEEITTLEQGQITSMLAVNNDTFDEPDYYLVYADTKVVDEENIERLKELSREDFVDTKRFEELFELLQVWVDEADFVINERAYERFLPEEQELTGDDFTIDWDDAEIDWGDVGIEWEDDGVVGADDFAIEWGDEGVDLGEEFVIDLDDFTIEWDNDGIDLDNGVDEEAEAEAE